MKKILKITGIALISILGLLIVATSIIVAVFSSSGQLTKMVKKYVPEFITCEIQLDKADLTLFKTFPDVGVAIENVTLINPMAGSPSDTLADIGNLIVVVDAEKLMKEKEIVVKKCILEDAFVNLYVDSLGNRSYNVFSTNKNRNAEDPFDYQVDIEEVKLKNSTLLYADDRNGMTTQSKKLNLTLKGRMKNENINADLKLEADAMSLETQAVQLALRALNLKFKGKMAGWDKIDGTLKLATTSICLDLDESYLENDTLNLDLPLQLHLSERKLHLDPSQIGLNRYLFNLEGDAEITENKSVNLDAKLNTNTLVVEDVMTYLPEKVQQYLGSIAYSGKLSIVEAKVNGTCNDSIVPLISAKVLTDKARVNIPSLPYPFTEVNLDADLYLDLNTKANKVVVNDLKTKYNRSNLSAKGVVDDLLGAIGLNLKVIGDVPMTDLKGLLPENMMLNGRTILDLTTNFTVKQLLKSLEDCNLKRLSAKANLIVQDFSFDMDTIHVVTPALNAHLMLPAPVQEENKQGAYIAFNSNQILARWGSAINADLKDADVRFSIDSLKCGVEKLLLDAALDLSCLDVVYDTISVHFDKPVITFKTTPNSAAQGFKAHVSLDGRDMTATMGDGYMLNAKMLKVDGSMKRNKDKTDFLNQWNPDANIEMGNVVVKIDGLDGDIRIDNIDCLFDADKLDLKKSTLYVGHSDFSLQGNVVGIKDWLVDHKNLMKGELDVTSNVVNINEIIDLTSGWGTSSDSTTEGIDDGDSPFMVPEGVDFSFALNTKQAFYDNFDLNNLGGGMTVKDGTLILQEIGFTNKAAEMQLTAMYQSPRKNNLFLAIDFHLLNVKINDLLHMVPFIDTLVPMLKTFDGQAEFHIGAETNLKSNYAPKVSTLRAAADIEGKNLSVNDEFTFTKITDMLDISTDGEYRVDSLDVQLTAFKNEVDLWPSQIAIGKYKVTVDGRMTLDGNAEYHLSVTESPLPTRFGVSVSGPLNNLDYKFEKSKFPTLYKPKKRSDTEKMYIELKKRIADELKENVR